MHLANQSFLRAIAKKIPAYVKHPLLLLTLDDDGNVACTRDAGLMAAIDHVSAALLADEAPPAILFMDVLDEADVRARASAIPGAIRLLDWPGTAYLRLVFDDVALRRAAETALAGRFAPFPPAGADELCAQLADVLHWLERFRQNTVGARSMVADVASGDLPATALAPQQWLSAKHLASLNRLIAALMLSDFSSAASPLALARDAFLDAALEFEAEKTRAESFQASQQADFSTLSESADVLMARAAKMSATTIEIDSEVCKGNKLDRGPRV